MASIEKVMDELIAATKKKNVQMFACTHLPEYLLRHPSYRSEDIFNSFIELCEEAEPDVRIRAVSQLPSLCKAAPTKIAAMADVLAQLLTGDEKEIVSVKKALNSLGEADAAATVDGLFGPLITFNDVALRDKCWAFIFSDFLPRRQQAGWHTAKNSVLEGLINEKCQRVMQAFANQEYNACANDVQNVFLLLLRLPSNQPKKGVDVATAYAPMLAILHKFIGDNGSNDSGKAKAFVDLLPCFNHLVRLGVPSATTTTALITATVVPNLGALSTAQETELLKYVAEQSVELVGNTARMFLQEVVWPLLSKRLVDPVVDAAADTRPFDHVGIEAGLYAFSVLGSKIVSLLYPLCGLTVAGLMASGSAQLSEQQAAAKFTDFHTKITYLAQRGRIKHADTEVARRAFADNAARLAVLGPAAKSMMNILEMVRPLLKWKQNNSGNPPVATNGIRLSFVAAKPEGGNPHNTSNNSVNKSKKRDSSSSSNNNNNNNNNNGNGDGHQKHAKKYKQ